MDEHADFVLARGARKLVAGVGCACGATMEG